MVLRKQVSLLSFLTLLFVVAPVLAQQPNFGPALYGDGEVWGTKATTILPEPRGNNLHSFDKLFLVVNDQNMPSQLPVAEAAPGNRYYNGGRWITHVVRWTEEGMAFHDTLPTLTSFEEIEFHHGLGHLEIVQGTIPNGPPLYFQCPLLPVKYQ
jgi:hypothetical protein